MGARPYTASSAYQADPSLLSQLILANWLNAATRQIVEILRIIIIAIGELNFNLISLI